MTNNNQISINLAAVNNFTPTFNLLGNSVNNVMQNFKNLTSGTQGAQAALTNSLQKTLNQVNQLNTSGLKLKNIFKDLFNTDGKLFNGFNDLQSSINGVMAPIKNNFSLGLTKASDFDTAAKFTAIDGDFDLEKTKKLATELAQKYGIAKEEMAKAMQIAVQKGDRSLEEVRDTIEGTIIYQKSTMETISTSEVVDKIAGQKSVWGVGGKEAAEILNAGISVAGAKRENYEYFVKMSSGAAKGSGLDAVSLAGIAAAMGEKEVEGGVAATGFKNLMTGLSKGTVKKDSKEQKALTALKLDLNKMRTEDGKLDFDYFHGTISKFYNAATGKQKEQIALLLKEIAGENGFEGVLALLESDYKAKKTLIKQTVDKREAEQKANENLNSANASFESLKTSISNLMASLFDENLMSTIKNTLNSLTSAITDVTEYLKTKPFLKNIILGAGLGLVAIGGLISGFLALAGTVAAVKFSVLALAPVFKLFGGSLLLKGALGSVGLLKNGFLSFGGILKNIIPIVQTIGTVLLRAMLFNPVGAAITGVMALYSVIKNWDSIKEFFGNLFAQFESLNFGQIAVKILASIKDSFCAAFPEFAKDISGLFSNIISFDDFTKSFINFVDITVSGFSIVWDLAKSVGTSLYKLFTGDFKGAYDAFTGSSEQNFNKIKDMANKAKENFQIAGKIVNSFTGNNPKKEEEKKEQNTIITAKDILNTSEINKKIFNYTESTQESFKVVNDISKITNVNETIKVIDTIKESNKSLENITEANKNALNIIKYDETIKNIDTSNSTISNMLKTNETLFNMFKTNQTLSNMFQDNTSISNNSTKTNETIHNVNKVNSFENSINSVNSFSQTIKNIFADINSAWSSLFTTKSIEQANLKTSEILKNFAVAASLFLISPAGAFDLALNTMGTSATEFCGNLKSMFISLVDSIKNAWGFITDLFSTNKNAMPKIPRVNDFSMADVDLSNINAVATTSISTLRQNVERKNNTLQQSKISQESFSNARGENYYLDILKNISAKNTEQTSKITLNLNTKNEVTNATIEGDKKGTAKLELNTGKNLF